MIEYAPLGFSEHSTIGPHEGLRVTFAQTRSALTPDFVEEADFRDNINHLMAAMEGGGFALAPASDMTVAPGQLAVTIDFAVAGDGAISVAQAVSQLHDGLYGFLDLARRTYIRRVTRIDSHWREPIPGDKPDEECDLTCLAKKWGGIALLVGVGLYFLPEIKLGVRGALKARGAK